ncbi:hypothetical protein LINPERPRIM_LOCUS23550, partial [Linum perenne]
VSFFPSLLNLQYGWIRSFAAPLQFESPFSSPQALLFSTADCDCGSPTAKVRRLGRRVGKSWSFVGGLFIQALRTLSHAFIAELFHQRFGSRQVVATLGQCFLASSRTSEISVASYICKEHVML